MDFKNTNSIKMRLYPQQRELSESRLEHRPSICDVAKILIMESVNYVLQRRVIVLCNILKAELSGRNVPFEKHSFVTFYHA